MSVAINDTIADSVASPIVPRRPAWILSLLLDALLGASTYLASYWLRFDRDQLTHFLPTAWSTMPIVVAGQIAGLLFVNAYAPRPRTSWLSRVVVGGVLGTAAA